MMRISDDRYSRDRFSHDLALRFLRHEARTQTIRQWTGLTDDRIRNLYNSYISPGGRLVPRHRGKSPHQIAYFSRSVRIKWETAQLASLLSLLSVIPTQPSPEIAATLPGITRGEKLCYAFEAYRSTIPGAQISFEHTVFLTLALARGDQIRLVRCGGCDALLVTERFSMRDRRCPHCVDAAHSR
jgi:hypothetical protein